MKGRRSDWFASTETGKGAAAIAPFLKPNSSQRFESQTAVLADIHDIKSYADWMQVLLAGACGCDVLHLLV